jgi:glycosyltransferase involved in cell wall biosynthesis
MAKPVDEFLPPHGGTNCPMKILHLNTETGFRGGERQVQLLVEGLHQRHHHQLVIGRSEGQLLSVLAEKSIPVQGYEKPKLLGVHSPRLIAQVRSWATEFQPDIIHAHTGNAHTLAVNAFLDRYPVLTTRRVDFAIKTNYFSKRKYTRPGQHFIAISTGVKNVLLEGGVPENRIDIVFSGVNTDRVTGGDGKALRQLWLGEYHEGPLIGFVGALVDHKAPWILAQAAPLIKQVLPNAKVVFVGDGEERARIEAISSQHPNALHLAGWRDDIADCLDAFDLFVMPSKLEGLCTSLVDALAAGVPSIASRAGGMPDVVCDGKTGVLVPPLDAKALAEAVVRLWQSPALRKQYIAQGLEHVQANFTADAMVEGTEKVYESVKSRFEG